MKYSDKLKDPRWQRKRLEIMERDDFTCKQCDNKEKTLNVHHLFYEKDVEPWDYGEDAYVTLCEDCHKLEHEAEKKLKDSKEIILDISKGFGTTNTAIILGCLDFLACPQGSFERGVFLRKILRKATSSQKNFNSLKPFLQKEPENEVS